MGFTRHTSSQTRRQPFAMAELHAARLWGMTRDVTRWSTVPLWCGIFALVFAGCGGPAEPLGTVGGLITFQQQPVPNAVVLFSSDENNLEVIAEADEEGSYKAIRSVDASGLPPGTYRVAVTPPPFFPGIGPATKAPPKRPDIPEKYRSIETSGLTLTVKEGDNPFDIEMKP